MTSKIFHITIGFPRTDVMDILGKSSTRSGFEFVSLPKRWEKPFIKVMDKFSILNGFIRSGEVNKDDIILFTDAYDVLVVQDSREILRKFYAAKADIIFNAECNLYPNSDDRIAVKNYFDNKFDSKWRYLNSGCYIGYAWAVLSLLDYSLQRINNEPDLVPDDQLLSQDYFILSQTSKECYPQIKMDVNAEIFSTLLWSEDDHEINKSYIRNKITGSMPSIIHANGDKKNINIIKIYDLLYSQPSLVPLDIKCFMVEGSFVYYNPDIRKLSLGDKNYRNLVISISNNSRYGVLFTLENGYLTFSPDLMVDSGTPKIQPWEVVALGERLASAHDLPLQDYFEIHDVACIASQEISLGYFASNDFQSLYDACVLFDASINKALYEARHMNNLRLGGPYDVLI